MRYKIELKPQGAIGRDFGMIIPLAVAAKGGGSTITAVSASSGCTETTVSMWIVGYENNAGGYFSTVAVSDAVPSTVPTPNSCWNRAIFLGNGCVKDDDVIEWASSSSDEDLIVSFYDADLLAPHSIRDSVSRISGGTDYAGTSVLVFASVNGEQIGPSIEFDCAPGLYNSQWESWCISYAGGTTGEPCLDDTPCAQFTYPATPSLDCRMQVAPLGLIWDGATALTWYATQLSGDTKEITFTAGPCVHTEVVFPDDDYTGTSYEIGNLKWSAIRRLNHHHLRGMTMNWELLIGVAIAVLGVANTWVIFMVTIQRQDVKELRAVDNELSKDMAAIKVLVAGQYVTRDEFNLALRGQSDLILGRMDALSAQISERQARP